MQQEKSMLLENKIKAKTEDWETEPLSLKSSYLNISKYWQIFFLFCFFLGGGAGANGNL